MRGRRVLLSLVFVASGAFCPGKNALGQQGEKVAQDTTIAPASNSTATSTGTAAAVSAGHTSAAARQPVAGTSASAGASSPETASASAPVVRDRGAMLVEGEKRFQTNCGRCHLSPHHFPPRMIMTIERHMRVRATITNEDMRLIMLYLTQ
jgi:hypothetical protein